MTVRVLSVATGSDATPVFGSNCRRVAVWLFDAANIETPSREMPRPLFAPVPRFVTSAVVPREAPVLMSTATTLPVPSIAYSVSCGVQTMAPSFVALTAEAGAAATTAEVAVSPVPTRSAAPSTATARRPGRRVARVPAGRSGPSVGTAVPGFVRCMITFGSRRCGHRNRPEDQGERSLAPG